ncbi:MAG: segregation and condensation protein A [Thermoproteota archaeon]|jgi:segregation and condensation protein A
MIENSIQVKIDHFDGPLALLLHLIQKEEMDIKELSVTKITKQYLDYLKLMKNLNFDVAGEYLYMAATLLHIKSKYCIAEEEDRKKMKLEGELEITTRTQLVEKLEELERFKKLSEKLWNVDKKGHEVFLKPKVNRKAIINSILTPMELESLTTTMIDLMRRNKRKYTVVKRDRISIKEKLKSLKENLKEGVQTEFTSLLDESKDLDDKVITFISLLELARLKKINIFQNENFGSIYVDVVDSLEDFNVEVATGFEDEEDLVNEELANIVASGESVQDVQSTEASTLQ